MDSNLETLNRQAEKIFINELLKNGSNFEDVKSGVAFPASYPSDSFPIAKMQEFVMYHKLKANWSEWLDNKYSGIDIADSIFIVEGANWGDWDAFGERTRVAFRDAIRQYYEVYNISLHGLTDGVADEISKMIMDKDENDLRLNADNRDYQLAVLSVSMDQIKSLCSDLNFLVNSLSEMQTIIEKFHSYEDRTRELIKYGKEVIYSADYGNIEILNKIITESNHLIPSYNDLKGIDYSSYNFISELYISYFNGHISLSIEKMPKAENEIVDINFDPNQYLQVIDSQLGYLKEITHMARKEKESYELNRSSKSLFRLQIIMTISLFTSVAAIFSISMNQIESNWQTFIIIILSSIILTMGTYYFIARK